MKNIIGIIGAMDEEIEILKGKMNQTQENKWGDFIFISGILSEKSVVLLKCGIGKVNAAVGCSLMIDHFHPDWIVNTGSAGGIHSELTFGDVVLSESLIHHDADVSGFGYPLGQIPGLPVNFAADSSLILKSESVIDKLKNKGLLSSQFRYIKGQIGSGDIFMNNPDKIALVRKNFPQILAVEMEGAAIAQVCHLFKIPFLVIRAISDVAGKESPMKFDEFLPLAAKNSSLIVEELIKE